MKRLQVMFITIVMLGTLNSSACLPYNNNTETPSPISQQLAASETKHNSRASFSLNTNETEQKHAAQKFINIDEENTKLLEAAMEGNLEKATAAINNGAIVNTTNHEHDTPLCLACFYGFPDMIKLLLEQGARVDQKGNLSQSPLHLAVYAAPEKSYAPIVRLLLQSGANPYIQDEHGRTPLAMCVDNQTTEALEALLAHGVNPNYPNHYAQKSHAAGTSPLQVAVKYKMGNLIELLLAADAHTNTRINDRKTSLFACHSKAIKTVYDNLNTFQKNIHTQVQEIKKRAVQEYNSAQHILQNKFIHTMLPVKDIRTLIASYALPYASVPCIENNFHRDSPPRRFEALLIQHAMAEAEHKTKKQSISEKYSLSRCRRY